MAWKTSGTTNYETAEKTALASAQRTATTTSDDMVLSYGKGLPRGVMVFVDITVNAGSSASITVAVKGKDPASGKYVTLLTSASLTAVATVVLRVHPELAAASNTIAKDSVPETLQVVVTHGNSSPITYSVGLVAVG